MTEDGPTDECAYINQKRQTSAQQQRSHSGRSRSPKLDRECHADCQLFDCLGQREQNADASTRCETHTEQQPVEDEIDSHSNGEPSYVTRFAAFSALRRTAHRRVGVRLFLCSCSNAVHYFVDRDHRDDSGRKTDDHIAYQTSSGNLW